jgi:hypothetical protein
VGSSCCTSGRADSAGVAAPADASAVIEARTSSSGTFGASAVFASTAAAGAQVGPGTWPAKVAPSTSAVIGAVAGAAVVSGTAAAGVAWVAGAAGCVLCCTEHWLAPHSNCSDASPPFCCCCGVRVTSRPARPSEPSGAAADSICSAGLRLPAWEVRPDLARIMMYVKHLSAQ